MESRNLSLDVAVIGGGIAGLWALDLLRARGYSAALFESAALGGGQSVAAQGIIHSGLKYALGGAAGADAAALAAMPAAWRACIAGHGQLDLSGCRVPSDCFHLWAGGDPPARLSAFLAGKLLRSRVRKLSRPDFPELLRNERFKGVVYRLDDLVIDVPSLIDLLARRNHSAIFGIDWSRAQLRREGGSAVVQLPGLSIAPRRLLLAAGPGNETLLADLGLDSPAMQRRPLQQVLLRHRQPQQLFAHCLGRGVEPRLTVSTHLTAKGDSVWYLGGELASEGAAMAPGQLIARAQDELAATLPWVDLQGAEWDTVTVDRAEPAQASGLKPDGPFLALAPGSDNVLVTWPTKLSLCPALGEALLDHLRRGVPGPGTAADGPSDLATLATLTPLAPLSDLPRPAQAVAPWDRSFR